MNKIKEPNTFSVGGNLLNHNGMTKEEYDKFNKTIDEMKRGIFDVVEEEIDKVLFDKQNSLNK